MEATLSAIPKKATTADVATHLRLSPRTIANYRASGRIPFIRINARTIRYDLAEVEKAIRK